MASCTLVLAFTVQGRAAVDLKNQITTSTIDSDGSAHARKFVEMVRRELKACAGGVREGNVWASILDSTAAPPEATIACTQAEAEGHDVVFTYGDVPITLTEGVDFVDGANDTATGANLAAAINAHAILSQIVDATADTGTVTITPKMPSLAYDIEITTDETDAFDITGFAGGDAGAAQFFLQHFTLNRPP